MPSLYPSYLGGSEGIAKLAEMRVQLIRLKHEVKDALRSGVRTISTQMLNERLQHIAKLPRPGYSKVRCGQRCRCHKPIWRGRQEGAGEGAGET